MSDSAPLARLAMFHSHLKNRDVSQLNPEFPYLPKHERKQYEKFHLFTCRLKPAETNVNTISVPKEKHDESRTTSNIEKKRYKSFVPGGFESVQLAIPQEDAKIHSKVVTLVRQLIHKTDEGGQELITTESGWLVLNQLLQLDDSEDSEEYKSILYVSDKEEELFADGIENKIHKIKSSQVAEHDVHERKYKAVVIDEDLDDVEQLISKIKTHNKDSMLVLKCDLDSESSIEFDKWHIDYLFASCGEASILVLSERFTDSVEWTDPLNEELQDQELDISDVYDKLTAAKEVLL
ncbi:hypothetical protein G9P44_002779 [Scheffersomyces stipitis]|nr:hypothetical protein G9P44_002779 [Scheffersomyces stipitis]